jgi:antitoxin VapB
MPLNIKDKQTHEMARKLAALTGESMTKAVKHALQDKLMQLNKVSDKHHLAEQLEQIALYCAGLPKRSKLSPDEIIGYDDRGLPE